MSAAEVIYGVVATAPRARRRSAGGLVQRDRAEAMAEMRLFDL